MVSLISGWSTRPGLDDQYRNLKINDKDRPVEQLTRVLPPGRFSSLPGTFAMPSQLPGNYKLVASKIKLCHHLYAVVEKLCPKTIPPGLTQDVEHRRWLAFVLLLPFFSYHYNNNKDGGRGRGA